jgi:hypothetical protein
MKCECVYTQYITSHHALFARRQIKKGINTDKKAFIFNLFTAFSYGFQIITLCCMQKNKRSRGVPYRLRTLYSGSAISQFFFPFPEIPVLYAGISLLGEPLINSVCRLGGWICVLPRYEALKSRCYSCGFVPCRPQNHPANPTDLI